MALDAIRQALPAFRDAVEQGSGDFTSARSMLSKLKLLMTEAPSQVSSDADAVASADEAALCREVSDYAVLLSIKLNDGPGFERNVAQARRWHVAKGESAGAGERRLLITGLHLMYLLVEGRLGEFAMRVETLSAADAASPPVALALSQAEAVSFGKVVSTLAAPLPPALDLFAPLMSRLAGAARDSFADAASVAYTTLTVPDAVSLLSLPSPAALEAYIAARGLAWTVRGGVVTLSTGGKPKAALDAEGTMASLLAYATDVERIV